MAKVLLVDTNFSSRPIFNYLVKLGHEVHVVGSNPYDCLAQTSERYWQVDYADTRALSVLVEKEKFRYLVPGCTDRSYSSCAIVAQGRFPGIASVSVDQDLNHKDLFRSLGERIGLPVPKLQWKDSLQLKSKSFPVAGNLHWPLVVKPVDGFSGKGIAILQRSEEFMLHEAMSTARSISSRGQCIIESYVHGQLHSHSAFLNGGQVVSDVIVEEHCTANPVVVDTSRVLPIIRDNVRDKLRRSIELLAKELELTDGLVHTQFILNGDDISLIEITRRCPGDLYSQLIELSGYKDYVSNYVRPFLGLPLEGFKLQTYVPIMRHTVTVPVNQNFDHLHFRQIVSLERWVPLAVTGQNLGASPAGRVGILFTRANDEAQLSKIYATTLARELYEVVG